MVVGGGGICILLLFTIGSVIVKTQKECLPPGFPRALEIMVNLEILKKSFMHGKIMDFEIKNE